MKFFLACLFCLASAKKPINVRISTQADTMTCIIHFANVCKDDFYTYYICHDF